jgi:hypothetical protein
MYVLYRGADKSLARPISRRRRTKSIVWLETVVCSCAELQVFSCYKEAKRKHIRRRASLVIVACYLSGRAKDLSAPLCYMSKRTSLSISLYSFGATNCMAKRSVAKIVYKCINHLTPNGHFSGRTTPLTYRCCIFYLFNR